MYRSMKNYNVFRAMLHYGMLDTFHECAFLVCNVHTFIH